MDWLGELAKEYDILLLAVGYWLYKEGWPWLRDRVFPVAIKDRREDRRNERRVEDRLFAIAEQTISVLAQLQKTMEALAQQIPTLQHLPALSTSIANIAIIVAAISQDMAGLYGVLGMQRPSRASVYAQTAPPTEPPKEREVP